VHNVSKKPAEAEAQGRYSGIKVKLQKKLRLGDKNSE